MAKNWWKLLLIALGGAIVDVAGHIIDGTPLPDLPRSVIAETLGIEATVFLYFVVFFFLVGFIFSHLQEELAGGRISKGLRFGGVFGLLCFLGVVEVHAIQGTPLWGDIRMGIADALPVMVMGVLLGRFVATDTPSVGVPGQPRSFFEACSVALLFIAGRYFSYVVVGIESGYSERAVATLLWTVAMGLCLGLMVWWLGQATRDRSAFRQAARFSVVVFGPIWTAYNLFMAVVFTVPVFSLVTRALLDVAFVFFGVWLSRVSRRFLR